jgi:hypothetical protein
MKNTEPGALFKPEHAEAAAVSANHMFKVPA